MRAGEERDLGAIRQLTDRILQSALQDLSIAALEDGKRVAFLLGRQVTVSATVGEIRTLAKQTRTEREAQLKKALDAWEARANGQESDYRGSLGVDVRLPVYGIPIGVDGKVKGEMKKKLQEEEARRQKETLETLHRGLDEVKDHFSGKAPTLTGIQFDQKNLNALLGQVEGELKESRFTFGNSQDESPPVRVTNAEVEVFDARALAEEVAEARERYRAMKEVLKDDRRLREIVEAVKKTEGELRIWAKLLRMRLSERIMEGFLLEGHKGGVNGVAFSPDGKLLASCSADKTVRVREFLEIPGKPR